jgi:large subunit ribosomal protein L13
MNFTRPTKISDIKREWHLIDVKGQILGRVATGISQKLIGKGKPYFVRNLDCGDYVIVINAGMVKVTGNKAKQKIYDAYSGYPGGHKKHTFADLLVKNPQRIINEAVRGMLPNNNLRDQMLKRLFVYKDSNHPYQSKLKSL